MQRPDLRPASLLAHPVLLLAVLTLAVNDHLLKGSGVLPAWLTGKLSDLAGLFFFPVLLAGVLDEVVARSRWARGGRWVPAVSFVLTGVLFTSLKIWPAFNSLVTPWWGASVLDPSDLLCLAALGPAWTFLHRARPVSLRASLRGGALVSAALATMATQMRKDRHWDMTTPGYREAGCAFVPVFVDERPGSLLVLVSFGTWEPNCTIRIAEVALQLPSRVLVKPGPDRTFEVHGTVQDGQKRSTTDSTYFVFDADGAALWAAGERTAIVTLKLLVDGVPARVSVDFHSERNEP